MSTPTINPSESPSCPPGPPPTPPGRRSWPRRHPVWTGWIVLGALTLGIGTAAGVNGGKSATGVHHNPSAAAPASPSQPTPNYTPPATPQPSGPPTGAIGDTLTITQNGQDAARVTITRVA